MAYNFLTANMSHLNEVDLSLTCHEVPQEDPWPEVKDMYKTSPEVSAIEEIDDAIRKAQEDPEIGKVYDAIKYGDEDRVK